ncbi:hypothetical protein [Roseiflexus sp.]|uniref:hypothetical protein n=1 Tax=Roseiflexus sp. TaxID=2562120 RepID=UPI00398B9A5E
MNEQHHQNQADDGLASSVPARAGGRCPVGARRRAVPRWGAHPERAGAPGSMGVPGARFAMPRRRQAYTGFISNKPSTANQSM